MLSELLNIHLIQFSPEQGEKRMTLEKLETLIKEQSCCIEIGKSAGTMFGGGCTAVEISRQVKTCHDNPTKAKPSPNIHIATLTEQRQLIVLPEMFSTAFTFEKHLAEPMNGETVQWMKQTAQSLNAAIYGSLLISENDKLYNRGLFVFPNGDMQHYDKRHCFRMSEEPKHITPGTELVTVEYAGWRLRLNICYDLRFPVWSRNTCKDGHYDYDVLLNVASWPSNRAYVWRTLLHARAIENQAYGIGVNRVGKDAEGLNYRGDTMVVDAKGTALAMANPNEEQVVSVQIKKSTLNEFRQKFCVGADWDTYEIRL